MWPDRRTNIFLVLVVSGLVAVGLKGRAADLPPPTFRSYAGAFLIDERRTHNFFVESELQLPLWRAGPLLVSYRYRESTPFLDIPGQVQAELLYTRYELHADFALTANLRLLTVGGYQATHLVDRHGFLGSYALGAGLGSPPANGASRFEWSALAGGYLDPVDVSLDWWADLHASWRLTNWRPVPYGDSPLQPALVVAGDLEAANTTTHLQPCSRVGPALQLLSGNGNRVELALQWYRNDHNPFYELSDNGLLVGANVVSLRDDDRVFDARANRPTGWLPLIWGAYDAGIGNDRRVTRFEMNVELLDVIIAAHRFTPFIWYENHQEYRLGDFDNVSYSVSLGAQSPVGLASPLSHGDPLVAGLDFLHRSDHSLNPNADRALANGHIEKIDGRDQSLIGHQSLNLLPRFRLQTVGWDLPYRDPSIYQRRTDWLNVIDWRVTAGLNSNSDRRRGPFAGQLGLNWDVATVQGYVVYLRGLGSIGNEDPDWLGEAGVRRPAGRVFTRFERYGLGTNLARGDALIVGIGVNL